MTLIDSKRPSKLYYFSERNGLERSLSLGEFRLSPPTADQILLPNDSYLVLSLTKTWDGTLFDAMPSVDSYLVVHDAEEFGERVHRAAQKVLPNWAGHRCGDFLWCTQSARQNFFQGEEPRWPKRMAFCMASYAKLGFGQSRSYPNRQY